MNRILNAIKCAHCHEMLESPVILPCNDIICKKHVLSQIIDLIRCEKCGVEHLIPSNGFQPVFALQEIIEDLGRVYKSAKKSCESYGDSIKGFEVLLKDPYFYTHGKINELKYIVQLKGEELKLIIDQQMKKLIDGLDEYERQSKEYLSSNEFKRESKKLENELKAAQSNLNTWLESLNKLNTIRLDEEYWKSIKQKSEQELKCITEQMEKLKNKLLLNKFDENQKHVNCFKNIKIDSIFEDLSINRSSNFSVSRIIDESLAKKLEELLKNKDLNGRKWSLLYQGSRDGFGASDFRVRCSKKLNTLTIVKSTNGNIFGGFTSALWNSIGSFAYDQNAFIYSLINKENRPLIFEHSSSNINSIVSHRNYCPTFGRGPDFHISNFSNTNTKSNSNIGQTYTHPEYAFGSERAKTILAGSYYFQVKEIEVFQMQQ